MMLRETLNFNFSIDRIICEFYTHCNLNCLLIKTSKRGIEGDRLCHGGLRHIPVIDFWPSYPLFVHIRSIKNQKYNQESRLNVIIKHRIDDVCEQGHRIYSICDANYNVYCVLR